MQQKTYIPEITNKEIKQIFKKMFEIIGKKYTKKKVNSGTDYTWSEKQKETFTTWLIDFLKVQRKVNELVKTNDNGKVINEWIIWEISTDVRKFVKEYGFELVC